MLRICRSTALQLDIAVYTRRILFCATAKSISAVLYRRSIRWTTFCVHFRFVLVLKLKVSGNFLNGYEYERDVHACLISYSLYIHQNNRCQFGSWSKITISRLSHRKWTCFTPMPNKYSLLVIRAVLFFYIVHLLIRPAINGHLVPGRRYIGTKCWMGLA